jgi:hypothetical protein
MNGAADLATSFIPGKSEVQDALILSDPESTPLERKIAGASLSVNTIAAVLPNASGAIILARGVAGLLGKVRASSKALGRAMEAAGVLRPVASAAHHIVAGTAPAAERARAVLERFGIGINDAVNGVFLPATRASPNAAGAAVHSMLHTDEYYQTVNQMLLGATTRAEAEAVLDAIRQALLSGGL